MIRILLAEDEEAMRTYLARALGNAGYDVVVVDRGTHALPLLVWFPPRWVGWAGAVWWLVLMVWIFGSLYLR